MNLLSQIIERLNQRIGAGNIFDQIYGLSELSADGNEKAWVHYIGNGQAVPVTNFDAHQATIFWAKRGKITVQKVDSIKLSGCKALYETKFTLSAYAVARKSHLPCDAADAQDWLASRVLRLVSGTDPLFKTSIGVVSYEVIPNGYANEVKSLTANYEFACVTIDVDVNVVSPSEDGCYDTCGSGDIPLPDLIPCTPCLTEVAVDGVTITGNGTEADPLVAIGGGGGGVNLRVQDEGSTVTNAATTINFTGAGVTASLASPGNVTVNIPAASGGAVDSVNGQTGDVILDTDDISDTATNRYTNDTDITRLANTSGTNTGDQDLSGLALKATTISTNAPLTGGGDLSANRTLSIPQANGSTDGYLDSDDWNTFNSKGNGTVTSVAATVPNPTNPAFSVNVPNNTTTPSVDITANGVVSQYVRGDGSLATFPNLPLIYKDVNNQTAVTGVTTNTKVVGVLIPANTVTVGSIINFKCRLGKTGSGGFMILRIYANTADSITTPAPTLLMTSSTNNINQTYQGIDRNAIVKSATVTQTLQAIATSVQNDAVITQAPLTNSNIDWTVNQYLIFAIQNASAADSTVLSYYEIEIK